MTIFIILPIYNEVLNLGSLVNDIDQNCQNADLVYQILAIDDGSSDDSDKLISELAEKFPITILTHKRNRGLGETIRDGFEAAADIAKPEDILVRMDADCTHEPKYIISLVNAINAGADIAIASRFPKNGGQEGLSKDRIWISKLANLAFRVCFPLGGLREYTCGYRAYRASIVQKCLEFYGNSFIQLRGLGFCCTVEKLLKLHLMGAKMEEVPFVLRYNLKKGASKMAFNVTTFGYVIMVVLYHWPLNGWRASARRELKNVNES